MNQHLWTAQLTPYDADYALWCVEQGKLLREGKLTALDRENLAEEIEGLARSDRLAIGSHLKIILVHLLKWRFQPAKRTPSWETSIDNGRDAIERIVQSSPSLRAYPKDVLADEYVRAVRTASKQTRLPLTTFPETCPFTVDQVLNRDFFPEPEANVAGSNVKRARNPDGNC